MTLAKRQYKIEPIPTVYKDVTFRSRLEARWAVFFTTLGIKWAYEPKAFSLLNGGYVPDFHLPYLLTWIEVKPLPPIEREKVLARQLANELQERVIITVGPPIFPDQQTIPHYSFVYRTPIVSTVNHVLYQHKGHNLFGFFHVNMERRLSTLYGWSYKTPRLYQAYIKAAGYKFTDAKTGS